MKRTIIAALALGFATTMAYAQTDTAPRPPAADQPQAASPAPHGPHMRGPGSWHKHHGMMMGSKAAHFRVRAGDIMINVKCAEDDTTAACGETVMKLLDRLQAGQSSDEDQGGGDSAMNE